MKTILKLSLVFLITISVNNAAFSQSWTDWGRWNSVNCFKGVDFRLKSKYSEYSGKYEAYVEFKNRYYDDIHFNYKITGGSYTTKNNRVTVRSGSTYKTWIGGSYTSSNFYVYIDKLRFGNDGLQDYADCDK